jgi:hypothetical protein
MKEHLMRFQHIVVQLNAVGCNVAECDLVARLLQSLPSEDDPLVQAIRQSVNEVTLRRLIGAIQSEALRIESKTTKPKTVALNAAKTSKQGKSKIDKKDVKCYNCGKKGHYKSECRKPLKTEMNKNESKNDV